MVTIGMATELKPSVKLPMMRQQRTAALRIYHPRRTGDVPFDGTTLEAGGLTANEVNQSVDRR